MAVKIYRKNAAIIIEGLYPDKQIINCNSLDWSVINGIYSIRDKIENQQYKLGAFSDITDENDIAYSSDEELQDFLNSVVNINVSAGSLAGTTVSSIIKDKLGNDALATIFGDLIIGTRIPSISGQFQYGLVSGNTNPKEDDATVTVANGGTVEIVNSELLIKSGIANNGSASIESNDYVRYLPGFEMWVAFTAKFETPDPSGDLQRAGLFDANNGFFLKYDSTGLYFVRRKLGVDNERFVNIATVFPDGTFNPEKGNIYFIKYGYLGFATIAILAVNPDNGFSKVSKLKYAGLYDTIHTAQTFLPLRAESINLGSVTNKILKIGSVSAGIVNGSGHYPATRFFTERFTGAVTAGTTLVAIFRNKTTFAGIENRIRSQLLNVSAAFDGTKPLQIVIKRNPTITTPGTFSDIDPNSVFEISTDSVINTNTGRYMKVFDIGKVGQIDKTIKDLEVVLRAGEWASFELITTGAGDYTAAIRWNEQF